MTGFSKDFQADKIVVGFVVFRKNACAIKTAIKTGVKTPTDLIPINHSCVIVYIFDRLTIFDSHRGSTYFNFTDSQKMQPACDCGQHNFDSQRKQPACDCGQHRHRPPAPRGKVLFCCKLKKTLP